MSSSRTTPFSPTALRPAALPALAAALVLSLTALAASCPAPDPPPPISTPSSTPGTDDQAPSAELPAFDHTHAAWTAILARHVHGDRFDYAAVKADRAPLDAYLEQLHAVTPALLASWTREQRYAFWINVYNAHTVSLVAGSYPIDSIRDLGGALFGRVWDEEFIELRALHPNGDDDLLSLDDVEHQILRPRFEDARVHVAVNCASMGCPPLRAEAFVAERLDAQLDDQARRFVADTARNSVDREKGDLYVSAIFDWFGADFERDAGSVREWFARYSDEETAAWIRAKEPKVRFLDYSWKLNDVEPAKE